jgi:RNA polymerase sigma-70 factor (ECF subfamily)
VDPADPLFRREAARIVATLTRVFGLHNLSLAEDVAQDTLCRAVEVWPQRGLPDNPSAWLMVAAKNRALSVLRHERRVRKFAPELGRLLETEWTVASVVQEAFEPNAVREDQLRMMFSCCHPRLPEDAHVALALHVLCGFSVAEVASTFLSSEAAIEKRLTRAKKVLARSKNLFACSAGEDFQARLPSVHRALYLLFSEGYHGAHPESVVRAELCGEAIHLATMLSEHRLGATPTTFALCALMCLHAARLPARADAAGDLSPLVDQDRSHWDARLIAEGLRFFGMCTSGTILSEYHVEAAIAFVHASASSVEDTDWSEIVSLYDRLLTIRPTPVIALHRAVAVAQHEGAERGLQEVRAIREADRFASYPFHHATLGELELRCERPIEAAEHFRAALALARNPAERRFFERRIGACDAPLAARARYTRR